MKIKIRILALALVLLLAVAGVVLANGGVELPRWALGGGATDSATAGSAALRATLGQPVVGVVSSSGGDVTLGQGFWHGGTPGYDVYLPLVIHN